MAKTYHLEVLNPYAKRQPVCDYCGEPADVVIVADFPERDTGYVHEVNMCNACYENNVADPDSSRH
jgi:hypothetical protein